MQVKIIQNIDQLKLESEVNTFISTPNIAILDIQYSYAYNFLPETRLGEILPMFSVMIIYEDM